MDQIVTSPIKAWSDALKPALSRVRTQGRETPEVRIARELERKGFDISLARVQEWTLGTDAPRDPGMHEVLLDDILYLPKSAERNASLATQKMFDLRQQLTSLFPLAYEDALTRPESAGKFTEALKQPDKKRSHTRPASCEKEVLSMRRVDNVREYDTYGERTLRDIMKRTGSFAECCTCARHLAGAAQETLGADLGLSGSSLYTWEAGHVFPNDHNFEALHQWMSSRLPEAASRLKYLYLENQLAVRDSYVQAQQKYYSHTLPSFYYKAQIAKLFDAHEGREPKKRPEWSTLVRPIRTKHDYVEALAGMLYGADESTVYQQQVRGDNTYRGDTPRDQLLDFFAKEQELCIAREAHLPEKSRSPRFFDRALYDGLRTVAPRQNGQGVER